MNLSRHFPVVLILASFSLPVHPQGAEMPSFYLYKAISTGYTGFRCALLFSAPLLDPSAGGWIYDYYAVECHQLPERSFYLNGRQMPLCARCTGIAVGMFAGNLVYPLFGDRMMDSFYSREWVLPALGICCLGMVPLVVDGTVQLFTEYRSNNPLRLATGVLFGVSLTLAFDVLMLFTGRVVADLIRS
jgi:uncharacterized membrane protein